LNKKGLAILYSNEFDILSRNGAMDKIMHVGKENLPGNSLAFSRRKEKGIAPVAMPYIQYEASKLLLVLLNHPACLAFRQENDYNGESSRII
jgi:hypothetical protein